MASLPQPAARLLAALALLLPLFPLLARAQTPAPAHPGTMIGLNDFGTADIAYLTLPNRAPRGGVVVIHDSWGLTDAVKTAVDRLAREGYVAIAPDLLNGQVTGDPQRAEDFQRALDHASAVKTILAAVRCLRESPRFRTERVGAVGWGLGAALALEAGAVPKEGNPAVDVVAVIGLPLPTSAKIERIDAPLLALFRGDDAAAAPAARRDFAAALDQQKKLAEIHVLNDDAKRTATWRYLLAFLDRTFTAPPAAQPAVTHLLQRMNPFHDDPAPTPPKAAAAAP